jgi:hypothetical protein
MKTILSLSLGILLVAGLPANLAYAHGEVSCSVPRSERQPSVRLQRQLKEAGWKVAEIQIYNGCYEVYGFDENGDSVEAFFDPRTLERLQVAG